MTKRGGRFALVATAVFVIVMFVGTFFWLGVGCSISFTDVAEDRARLIDGIESYWNLEELEDHLRTNLLSWEIKQGQRPGPGDRRPPFIVDTVTIKGYAHLGLVGELKVELFNNRVATTRFFPLEVDKYLIQLAKAEGIDLVQNEEIRLSRFTRVWRAELGRERRRYVGWEDLRLSDEISTWIKRYA